MLLCQVEFVNKLTGGGIITNEQKRDLAFVTKARKRMIDRNVTQVALARKYGKTTAYVSMVLRGKRTLTPQFREFLEQELSL